MREPMHMNPCSGLGRFVRAPRPIDSVADGDDQKAENLRRPGTRAVIRAGAGRPCGLATGGRSENKDDEHDDDGDRDDRPGADV